MAETARTFSPDGESQRPLPPTGGNDPRFTFTATITLEQPAGTPLPNVYYVFTGQPELTGFHNDISIGDPDNHNISILSCNIGFTILAAIVVALRMWTRSKIIKAVGIDDAMILLALMSAIVIMSLNIVAVHFKIGWHTGDVGASGITIVQKYHWLSQIVYAVCLGCTKLSTLAFILRLHPSGAFRFFRYLIFACFFFVASFMISSLIVTIMTCTPITGIYDTSIISVCRDRGAILYSISSLNVFTDILIVCLPIPMVIRVQIPVKQKIALFVVFLMGLFVCVASAVRMTTLNELATSGDPSWVMAKFSIWTAIEYDLAIICASLPTLKPPLNKILPSHLSNKLATIITNHMPSRRSSKVSNSRGNPQSPTAEDRSIHMYPFADKRLNQNWTSNFPRKLVGVTTTNAFYSSTASSDDCMIGDGIIRTMNVDVTSDNREWSQSRQSSLKMTSLQCL